MKTYFCSQYRDINEEDWKSRSCSIASLWMALKSLKNDFDLTPDDLLKEGLSINGYLDSGFWRHSSIVILAHNHGLAAFAEEFKSVPFGVETKYADPLRDYGVEKIFNFLKEEKGLVIVSVPKGFTDVYKPHSVLLHSVVEEDGKRYFVYNDSEKENEEEGKDLKISLEEFTNKWRKLAIFVSSI